jgi:hypothetical protein
VRTPLGLVAFALGERLAQLMSTFQVNLANFAPSLLGDRPLFGNQQACFRRRKVEQIADVVARHIHTVEPLCELLGQTDLHARRFSKGCAESSMKCLHISELKNEFDSFE